MHLGEPQPKPLNHLIYSGFMDPTCIFRSRASRAGALAALGLVPVLTASADTILAPMWDIRSLPMTWEIKASGPTLTAHSYFADGGGFKITTEDGSSTLATVGGFGDHSTGPLAVTPGAIYKMVFEGGFHVRPHWDGIEWARLGPGMQGAGPGSAIGFQSDAELGFDDRWLGLPSTFADTTWSYNVAPGERLSLSVEHVTGDADGADKFEFISPASTTTLADGDGLPGTGGVHWAARGGDYFTAPDPSSPQWEEYTAPTDEAGWWGFKLSVTPGHLEPYSWHYILDRTDGGADQYAYLRAGAIRPPVIPEASTIFAGGGVALVALLGWRARRRS